MKLNDYQYNIIIQKYEQARNKNEKIQKQHYNEIIQKIPKIKEIDDKIVSLSIEQAKNNILYEKNKSQKNYTAIIKELSKEKIELLKKAGYEANYLDLQYDCKKCRDTGYIGNKKCECFLKQEINILYRDNEINYLIENHNFKAFKFNLYSDKAFDETTGLTHRALARIAYNKANEFANKVAANEYANLLIHGNSGTGKTFLTYCISNKLLDKNVGVIYLVATELFKTIIANFNNNSKIDKLLTVDLLIIDDLGTESHTEFKETELFYIINERIVKKKSTIISTNLSGTKISNRYSERFFSRVAKEYEIIRLVGDDIRIKEAIKKQKNIKNVINKNDRSEL